MRKYCFSVDGISVSVFTDSGKRIAQEQIVPLVLDGELAVALSDGVDCDFSLECFEKNNTCPREPSLVLSALSYLFSRVLGYPSMTLDVSLDKKKYEIKVDKASISNFTENLGKCKIIYTKSVEFNDGVEIDVRIVNDKNKLVVVICEDAELFDKTRLSVAFNTLGHTGVSSALSVSYTDRLCISSVGDASFCEAIRVAIDVLCSLGITLDGGEHTALVNGHSHGFSLVGKEIEFHPKIKYIL